MSNDIKFDERPKHLTPILCETMRDKDNKDIGVKLSIGIKLPNLSDGVKWRLMGAMNKAIEEVLT